MSGPSTRRQQSLTAKVQSIMNVSDHQDDAPETSQSSRTKERSECNEDGVLDQDTSSGASSGGTPAGALSPTSRYGFLCFKFRSPRTLVDGRYRQHDPNSLPEPLKWGFIQWADRQRGPTRPLNEAENLYNNRTLRYWRLSTDYGRFLKHDEKDEEAQSEKDEEDDIAYEIVNGTRVVGPKRRSQPPPPATSFWTSPQRPYTAPPHHIDRSAC